MACYPRIALLAVLLVAVLIVLCTGTMLVVTVPSSLAAGDAFGPRYSDAAAKIAARRIQDALAVMAKPYQKLAHGMAAGIYPNHVAKTVLVTRASDLFRYVQAMAATIVAIGDQVKDIGVAFSDQSYVNCFVVDNASAPQKMHTCYAQDPKNISPTNAWRKDWTWTGTTLTNFIAKKTTFQPHTKNWYINAPKLYNESGNGNNTVFFSNTYVENAYRSVVIDVASPVFLPKNTNNTFLGVASVSLDVGRLSRFLSNISGMTPGTEVFLLDNTGDLVGASNQNAALWITKEFDSAENFSDTQNMLYPKYCPRFKIGAIRRVYCRYDAGYFPNSTALNALRWQYPEMLYFKPGLFELDVSVNRTFSPVVNTSKTATLTLKGGNATAASNASGDVAGNGVYYVSSEPVTLRGSKNLNWLVVVLVPERDVAGAIIDGNNAAIRIGGGVAGATCVVCALLLFLILRPLVRVAEQMGDAATLQDEHLPGHGPRSAFREVRAVQCAMYQLCGQLKKAKTFLPASMLALLTLTEDGNTTSYTGGRGGGCGSDEDEGSVVSAVSEGLTPRGGTGVLTIITDTSDGSNDTSVSKGPATAAGSPHNSPHHHRRRGVRRAKDTLSEQRSNSRTNVATLGLGAAAAAGTAAGGGGDGCSSHRTTTTVDAVVDVACRMRIVSILAANVSDFHKDVRGPAGRGVLIGRPYASLVAAAVNAASEHRGVLDSFHGDRFFVTFNAVKPCTSHATRAMKAALQLTTTSAALAETPFAGRVTAGVACGACLVGNMGNSTQRRFCVVGPAYTQAAALERLCPLYPGTPRVLTAGTAAHDAETAVELLHLDLVPMPAASSVNNSVNGPDACIGYEVVRISALCGIRPDAVGSPSDDWLYELQGSGLAHHTPTALLNRAFSLLQEGQPVAAAEVLLLVPSSTTRAGAGPMARATPAEKRHLHASHQHLVHEKRNQQHNMGEEQMEERRERVDPMREPREEDGDDNDEAAVAVAPAVHMNGEDEPLVIVRTRLEQWAMIGTAQARPMHDFYARAVLHMTAAERLQATEATNTEGE